MRSRAGAWEREKKYHYRFRLSSQFRQIKNSLLITGSFLFVITLKG